jgi:PAS domain S-box-containing protein
MNSLVKGKGEKKSVSEMKNENKTKKQLMDELTELRKEIKKLQTQICKFEDGEKAPSNINDLKETTEALLESKERYRTVVENIDLRMTLIDSNYKIIMTNAAQGRLFHKPAGEFVGKECFREFEKRNTVCPHCPGTKAMALRCRTEVETEGVLDNGIRFSVKIYAFPVFSSNGAVTGFIETVEDITERKRTEQELGYFRRQYELILQSAGEGILGLDLEGRHAFVNPSAASMLGYEVKELIGQDSHAIWHHSKTDGSPYPEQECPIYAAYKDGAVHHVRDEVFWRKDGTSFPVAYTSTPILEDGKLAGAVVTFWDITERKLAKENINESEKKFKTIFNSARDGILLADIETKKFYLGNEAICQMLGYSLDEIKTLGVEEIHPEKDLPYVMEQFEKQRRKGIFIAKDIPLKKKDGSVIYVDINSVPIILGERTYMLGMFRDITDRRMAEEEIRKLNEELEQKVIQRTAEFEAANRELEAFSYSVSHDLKAPLRAIAGFSSILIEDHYDELDDEGKRLLNIVRDNTQKMGELIEDILALSRIGRKEIDLLEIDMDKLAKAVFDEIKATVPEREIQFDIKPLSPAYGYEGLVRQVFFNLLFNAIKFTRFKENAIIEVGGYVEGSENIYYVKDNGAGFDMQYADKLFGAFQRLHGEQFEGTGIGLAIVQRIMHRHGGRIWAKGKVNEGATFYFTLPKQQINERLKRIEG